MVKIEKDEVRKYLDRVRGYKQDLVVYDSHVHPLEVFFGKNNGVFHTGADGSSAGCGLTMPETGAVVEAKGDEFQGVAGCRFKRAAQVLNLKRSYRNACPECFLNHMAVAGVDISLLLPVAPAAGEVKRDMTLLGSLFGENERFVIGCSVPNSIGIDEIDGFLSRMKCDHRARAVKLHPNVTEIDLAADWGKERAEAVLDACGKNHLPLVVHGGRSKLLKNVNAGEYGRIANMASINWSLSDNAVVIAHAGAYECTPPEVEGEVLPVLSRLLSHHSNLLFDLSGLDCETQVRILRRMGPERIVFGSDALYEAPWRETVKLIYSLEKAGCDPEKGYRMIGSETPERVLFKWMKPHAPESVHTAIAGR